MLRSAVKLQNLSKLFHKGYKAPSGVFQIIILFETFFSLMFIAL